MQNNEKTKIDRGGVPAGRGDSHNEMASTEGRDRSPTRKCLTMEEVGPEPPSSVQVDDSKLFRKPRVVCDTILVPPVKERRLSLLPTGGDHQGPDGEAFDSEAEDEMSTETDASTATAATGSSRKRRAKKDSSPESTNYRKTRRTNSVEDREDAYRAAEESLINNWREDKSTSAAKALLGVKPSQDEKAIQLSELSAKDLEKEVRKGMARIREVADYRKGVKGTTKKALRKVAALAETAVKLTASRSQTEEVRKLQAANDRLRREMDLLRREMEEVKRHLPNQGTSECTAGKSAPPPVSVGTLGNRKKWVSSDDESDDEARKSASERGSRGRADHYHHPQHLLCAGPPETANTGGGTIRTCAAATETGSLAQPLLLMRVTPPLTKRGSYLTPSSKR